MDAQTREDVLRETSTEELIRALLAKGSEQERLDDELHRQFLTKLKRLGATRDQVDAELHIVEHLTFENVQKPGQWADIVVSVPKAVRDMWEVPGARLADCVAPWVVDWSLKDGAGRPLPITADVLEKVVPEIYLEALGRGFWRAWRRPFDKLNSSMRPSADGPTESQDGSPRPDIPDGSVTGGPGNSGKILMSDDAALVRGSGNGG